MYHDIQQQHGGSHIRMLLFNEGRDPPKTQQPQRRLLSACGAHSVIVAVPLDSTVAIASETETLLTARRRGQKGLLAARVPYQTRYQINRFLFSSLTEKQQRYINLQANLKTFSSRYERLINQHRSHEDRLMAIKAKRKQLELLQQLIGSTGHRLRTLAERRDELRWANAEKRKNLPKYPDKVKMLEDYVLDRVESIDKLRNTHQGLLDSIKQEARRGIQQLVSYVFPISEVVLKEEQQRRPSVERSEEAETIAALADAKNTSYIRGKWVFHGSGISEVQYRIVGPSLPANGDYTAYLDWLAENKDDVPKSTANEITPSKIEAYRIVGALTYTAQLTQLLSFYLNVRLPYKIAYGDFCRKVLNEEQFRRKISRLNSNIMYLAYTQQVKLRALNEQHTLENLLAILDLERSDLGRFGYLDVTNAPLMKSVDSLLIGIETATESESEGASILIKYLI